MSGLPDDLALPRPLTDADILDELGTPPHLSDEDLAAEAASHELAQRDPMPPPD